MSVRIDWDDVAAVGLVAATEIAKKRAALCDQLSDQAEAEGEAIKELRPELTAMRNVTGCQIPQRKKQRVPGWQRFKVKYHK